MKVRFATAKEFKTFYPDCPYSFKGWVIERDGEVLVVGGLLLDSLVKTMILNIPKELPAKTLWKACKSLIGECGKFTPIFYAVRDENLPNSKRFLEKLGFKLHSKNNQEIYIWQH
jgi:hypothetical protein